MNTDYYDVIAKEAMKLAIRKNADYSGDKIDNISLTGVNGISVRLLDKVSRAYNLSSGKDPMIKDESLRDTFIDIVNYAVFAVMMIDGAWGNGKPNDDAESQIVRWGCHTAKKLVNDDDMGFTTKLFNDGDME